MSEAPTVFQRRIVIGAVLCVAAFALVGIRLVHVTLMKSLGDGRARRRKPSPAPTWSTATANCWPATCR